MGMSTHVVGYRPQDEKWHQMKAAWNACKNAGITVPRDVESFFNDEDPNTLPGLEVDIRDAVEEWDDRYRQGYQVDLAALPKDVKFLRFYNSY